MGKIFPIVTTLNEREDLFQKTIKLIETSFNYSSPNQFTKDFAPLIEEKNKKNCFILIDENNEVLAHIGVKEKKIKINNHEHIVIFLGAIATHKDHRGKGYFQTLMQHVLVEKKDECAFILLWSDQEELYKKYGFHLCGTQIEIENDNKKNKNYQRTTFFNLNEKEKEQIKNLYAHSFLKNYISIERSDEQWFELEKIQSADLYINKKNDQINSYFFMNKGQDLQGIIYEYGTTNDFSSFIEEISSYGKVWTAYPFVTSENFQYQFFLCLGDQHLFRDFVRSISNQKINIRRINLLTEEIIFEFNEELIMLNTPDFLRGVFGPQTFEEFADFKPLYISGLDSI